MATEYAYALSLNLGFYGRHHLVAPESEHSPRMLCGKELDDGYITPSWRARVVKYGNGRYRLVDRDLNEEVSNLCSQCSDAAREAARRQAIADRKRAREERRNGH